MGCLILLCVGCNTSVKEEQQARPPNIVFILADDLGWRDLGCMGSRFYETPYIDQLAAQGMLFTNAYANAPNCAPTRACILSGQYGPRHGVYTVGAADRGDKNHQKLIPPVNKTVLDTGFVTLAEVLQEGGYVCASVGKWHLGTDPENGPLSQGFNVNKGGNHAGHPTSYFSPYDNPDLPDGPEGEYLTDRLTEEALGFMETHQNEPFFLYFPHYAVHTPIQGKDSLTARFSQKEAVDDQDNAAYAAMIASLDESVGRMMEKLETLGLMENTLVVFSSDNGGHGVITSNTPLRGAKGMMYEGGIRVPLILHWPGQIAPNTTSEVPVISTDFFPTFLEVAGIEKPEGKILDGESLLPIALQQGSLERESIFWHFPAYLPPYSAADGIFRTTPVGAIRKGDFKLIEFFEDGQLELYNLREDIGEQNDLSETLPEKREELWNEMKAWREAVDALVPTQLNPDYHPEASTFTTN